MPDEVVYAVVGADPGRTRASTSSLDAWERLDDGRPRRLLIAGGPTEEDGVAEALERAAVQPTVLLHARQIPQRESDCSSEPRMSPCCRTRARSTPGRSSRADLRGCL